MDIRPPDSYKTETLVDDTMDSSQDISCHELEIAMIESMEEAWTKEAECAAIWSMFQHLLQRLKRIGYYDKEIQTIYELLSVHLYKYAYQVDDDISEETLQFIEKSLKTIRLSTAEQELLKKALDQLRSSHLRSGL